MWKGDRVRYKLVWFVPREALERTRDAVFRAGAGRIGDYERCSWYTAGTGTLLGGSETKPWGGEAGREERGAELRVGAVVGSEGGREGGGGGSAAQRGEEMVVG